MKLHPWHTYSEREKRNLAPEGRQDVFQYKELGVGDIIDKLQNILLVGRGLMMQTFEVTFDDSGSFQSSGTLRTVEVPSIGQHVLNPNGVRWFLRYAALWILFLALIAPYVIIEGLTEFQKGGSTNSQRVWLMTWLAYGQCMGLIMGPFFDVIVKNHLTMSWKVSIYWAITVIIMYGVPSIGGFVVVAQMIRASESCGVVG